MQRTSATATSALPRILLILFAAGWASNYFTALIPVLRASGNYPTGSLEAAFGIYALGLLPSLLSGGALADRFSPRKLTIAGTLVAAVGNVGILAFQSPIPTDISRFVVGIGVGLVMSAGTAWAGRVGPQGGGVAAGTALTLGFGIGPLVAGAIAVMVAPTLQVTIPVILTLTLSLVAVAFVLRLPTPVSATHVTDTKPATDAATTAVSIVPVLTRALPMALWVFACAATSIVTLVGRLDDRFAGPLAIGVMAFVTLGTGALTQAIARRINAGPKSGILGALFAALGFAVAAFAGNPAAPAFVFVCGILLGIGYGLCLRNGLMDIEQLAPPAKRGLVGGIYYVVTYVGFGLPFILTSIEPYAGTLVPMLVLAGLAVAIAALRAVQLRHVSQG